MKAKYHRQKADRQYRGEFLSRMKKPVLAGRISYRSFGRVKRILTVLFLVLMLPGGRAAEASGRWFSQPELDTLGNAGFLVNEYTGVLTLTFLGDCTLGGEGKSRSASLGFFRKIQENGLSYPLLHLSTLTLKDDLTVANLEGVLSDRQLDKVEKEYNFIGPTMYTEILTSAGIDCVTLANNHSHDYGEAGYEDTKNALEEAAVCWFGTDQPAVWQSDEGVLIGFLGVSFSLTGNRYRLYRQQADRLREAGCAVIVTVMHAGTEYSRFTDSYQRQIVSRAAACGSSLVIGHHPHVVQGYEAVQGIPVVYSLGNCSFGGTTHAKDSDALVVQADLSFQEGSLREITLRFYPISITGDERYNDYSPVFLKGADAERVLNKMRESTGMDPGTFAEDSGAAVTFPVNLAEPGSEERMKTENDE